MGSEWGWAGLWVGLEWSWGGLGVGMEWVHASRKQRAESALSGCVPVSAVRTSTLDAQVVGLEWACSGLGVGLDRAWSGLGVGLE